MTEDPLPYGPEHVNMELRPLKVVPFKKEHYFKSPSCFWKRTDISLEMKGLMGILQSHLNKDGACWPTKPQLQAMTGLGRQKVAKLLNRAKERKLITWARFTDEWGHKRNRYTLLFLRNPTPRNQPLATGSKSTLKVSTIYLEGQDTVKEQSAEYG